MDLLSSVTTDQFSREVDASVVVTLASILVVISAVICVIDRTNNRHAGDGNASDALLWMHIWFIVGAAGLELGRQYPFSFSAPLVLTAICWGLVSAFIAIETAMTRKSAGRTWPAIAIAIGVLQSALAIISDSAGAVFVSSSLVNGGLAGFFAIRLNRIARARAFDFRLIMILPFCAIALAYGLRLMLIVYGVDNALIVAFSVVIGLLISASSVFWLFSAISIRGQHLLWQVERTSSTDALTELGNRMSFERFMAKLAGEKRHSTMRQSACLSIDMDRFKEINDTYGHEAGDLVLISTARRLQHFTAGLEARIFRIGGDEFVIWCTPKDAAHFREDVHGLLTELGRPVDFGAVSLNVGVSIGVEMSSDNTPPREIVRRSDIALYRSKKSGRNRVTFYSEALGNTHDQRLRTLEEFRAALSDGAISAYFQPQFSLSSNTLSGCEVLARWHHPEHGLVSPGDFIPLAKELGLLAELDRCILDQALQALNLWDQNGLHLPRISVNVSMSRLRQKDLLEELTNRKDLPRGRISFEMLETVFADDDDALKWNTDRLREMGIWVEIDDFGTGHAAISTVVSLNPDRIKIDRFFVRGIGHSQSSRDILKVLIDFTKLTGAVCLVEGVETIEQRDIISALGGDEIQGFVLAHPMPRDEMQMWLEKHSHSPMTERAS